MLFKKRGSSIMGSSVFEVSFFDVLGSISMFGSFGFKDDTTPSSCNMAQTKMKGGPFFRGLEHSQGTGIYIHESLTGDLGPFLFSLCRVADSGEGGKSPKGTTLEIFPKGQNLAISYWNRLG